MTRAGIFDRVAGLEARVEELARLCAAQAAALRVLTVPVQALPVQAGAGPDEPLPIGALAPEQQKMARVAARIAAAHRLSVEQLGRATRQRGISWPRQDAMAAMQAEGLTVIQIARFFDLDWKTVCYGIRTARARQVAA